MLRRITAAACCDKGRVRLNNEDSFYLDGLFMPKQKMNEGGLFAAEGSGARQLYAVCDGMGGHELGEEASFIAVSMLEALRGALAAGEDFQTAVGDYIARANEAVLSLGDRRGAGTTLALLYLYGSAAYIAHMGDSRAYHLRNGALTRLTEDHSEVQRLINLGILAPDEARLHPGRHALTLFLGYPAGAEYSFRAPAAKQTLKQGDTLLLCSDGLTDMLEDDTIASLLCGAPAHAARALVDAALAAGGRDNVTALVVRVEHPGLPDWLTRPRRLAKESGGSPRGPLSE